jgi:TRAP-type uncharacterized transport system substrate-binding protein
MATEVTAALVSVPATAATVTADADATSSCTAAQAAGPVRPETPTASDLLAAATAQFVASGGSCDAVKSLVAKSQDLALVKKKITKDLKNARKRQSRLKCKARALSVADLMDVLVLRAQKQSERAPSAADPADVPAEAAANCDVDAGVLY